MRLRSGLLAILVSAALVWSTSPVAHAAAGDLDPTFSGNGKLSLNINKSDDYARGVAIQADGKIVMAGFCCKDPRFVVVRLGARGALDPTFGGDGIVKTNFSPGADGAWAVAIQPDGKIVVAGSARTHHPRFAIARYESDGTLDPTFGVAGEVTTTFTEGGDVADSVAIAGDGSILIGGRHVLARYTADGTLDTSFGSGGWVATEVASIAIQADDKIIVSSGEGDTISRYDTNGALDTSFSADGSIDLDVGFVYRWANSVAIQPDGKILGAGTYEDCEGGCSIASLIFRFNDDGSFDSTFSSNGVTSWGLNEYDGVAVQADGKIVTTGFLFRSRLEFGVVRFNSDGSVDMDFGNHGRSYTDFSPGTDRPFGVAIQSDGKIVAAGVRQLSGSDPSFAAARFLAS